MKIEVIKYSLGKGKLVHITSSSIKEVKIGKRDEGEKAALAYIENHANETRLKVKDIATSTIYFNVYLTD